MQLASDLYLVGSGLSGMGLTNRYDCNCYLLDGGGGELALIDCGAGVAGPDYILNAIQAHGFRAEQICLILLTHDHVDHSGGVSGLRQRLPNAQICLHENEVHNVEGGEMHFLGLQELQGGGLFPENTLPQPFNVDEPLTDFAEIKLGKGSITAILIGGHSPGSVCYLYRGHDGLYLFSGDTVMTGGRIFMTNTPGSSLTQYRAGCKKLAGLGVDALLPGHGSFTMNFGQEHIDRVNRAFERMTPPRNYEM